MHACVHAWTVHVLNAENEISMAKLALTCVGKAVPTEEVPKHWAIGRRLLPHASKCLKLIHCGIDIQSPDNRNICDVVLKLGRLNDDHGKLQEAEAMYLWALESYEKVWGPEHVLALITVNNLGAVYSNQGKMQEAEAMIRSSVGGF